MTSQPQRRNAKPFQNLTALLPILLPILVGLALAAIILGGQRQLLTLAQGLAEEDAALLNWWQVDQRQQINAQAAMLAQRAPLAADADFGQLAAAVGLDDATGYVAWIDGAKTVRAELNGAAKIGDPTASKLFAFAPAIGQPAADFWQENGQPFWMSMAPVEADLGGGNVIVQRPIDEALAANLAQLMGRDVIFYSYAEQMPLISSNSALVSDPPRLTTSWMNEVAAGQLPKAIQTVNSAGGQVVSMFAFPDFAAISYSGYLALVEPVRQIGQLLPTGNFWLAALIATLAAGAGALVLQRTLRNYLANQQGMPHGVRQAAKWRMSLITLAALLPMFLAAGYILVESSNRSAQLDRRTGQIAKDLIMPSLAQTVARVNQFAGEETAQSLAPTAADAPPELLAQRLRLAHGLDFAVVENGGEVTQAGVEDLNVDAVAALAAIAPGQVGVVQVGKTVLLAGRQDTANGGAAYVGVRMNKLLPNITDLTEADLTLVNGRELVVTTLVEREIETLLFDAAIENEVAQNGQASYLQKVGWNPGKLTLFGLNIGDGSPWRMVIAQTSTTWSNVLRGLQGFGLAMTAAAFVLASIVLLVLLNVDKPLLLRRLITGYMFILPAVVWLVWWQLGPALFAGYLSFHKWSVLTPAKPYVGFHNFQQIWQDDVFWGAMKNTIVYLFQIPIGMALSLALAMALNRPLRGIKALRTIYYMPAVTSVVVVSLMWKLLYNKDLGIFNYILSFAGLGPYGFLQSTSMAMPSIMGMSVWLGLGSTMILFLAGLQSIPNDYYEAADVDGAGGWHKFLHITIPLLAPTTFFIFITSVIGSFQVFGPVYVLTQGGPAGATDVAVHRIYFEAWQNLRFGYASAETVILFAILFVVTAIQFRYFGRNVSYG
ncbi:MAG: sugar ABC transporter permease [Caldilineaceae bacterium]